MRHGLRLLVLIVAAALLLPHAARAQNRSGFWGGAGVGVGMADTNCDNCGTRDQQTGGMLAGRAGWAITPQVLVGAELTFWNKVVQLRPNACRCRLRRAGSSTCSISPST
jgi:hypothetical protein